MKFRKLLMFLAIGLFSFAPNGFFNTTYIPAISFQQFWGDPAVITADDNWTNVPGIMGYRGDALTAVTGTDPQTIVTDGSATPVDVIANQSSPNTNTSGGVAEFDGLPDGTIALQGSGTASAPHVVLHINTTGQGNIVVSYTLRDIDGSLDNAVQPVALQYRVGGAGNYINLPGGFVADATTGPSLATLTTPVSVTLPAACNNQAQVQIRIITTNAAGNDEWVGVDNLLAQPMPLAETFAADCTTPKVDFNLGENICGKITDPNYTQRRFQWGNPAGYVARQGVALTMNPQTDSWTLPATKISELSPGFFVDNRGTWRLNDNRTSDAGQQASTFFRVHDPANPAVDLSVTATGNPNPIAPGNNITYTFYTLNNGPDPAVNAEMTMYLPANAVFVSASGPAGWTVPASPTGNAITCTRALLPAAPVIGAVQEEFTLVVTVPVGTPNNTMFNAIGAMSSTTEELRGADNKSATFGPQVVGGSSGPALISSSASLIAQSCLPLNSSLDPGETVTVSFCVTNNGNQAANNVVGTLQATNNVTSPGAAVSFGNIAAGATVCRDITFIGNPAALCGSSLIPSINFVSDPAGANRGTVVFSPFYMYSNVGLGTVPQCCISAPPCDITSVTFSNQGSCNNNGTPGNTTDDYYTADVTVTFINQPATGNLQLEQSGAVIDVVTIPVGSLSGGTHTFTGVRLRANGAANTVEAEFTVPANACTQTVVAPTVASCSPPCDITSVSFSNQGTCNDNGTPLITTDDYYTADITITFINQPGSGNLQLEQSGAVIDVVTVPVGSLSGGTHTFTGVRLRANGAANTVEAEFTVPANACTQTVVAPTVAPCSSPCTLTCPANIIVSNDLNQCGAVVNFPPAGTTGVCGTVTASPLSGSFFPVGTTLVTFTSSAGPTCSFNVTVNDSQVPTITCPANIVLCGSQVVNYTVPFADNCPGATLLQNTGLAPGAVFPVGTTTNSFTVTDGAGLTATCSFTVTIHPIPDAIATPPSQTVCSNAPITTIVLTGAVPGTTYNWTRNNTATVTGIAAAGSGNIAGTLVNTTAAPITVTFTITPTANGCPGTPVNATVLVNPTPTAALGQMQVIITGSNGDWTDEVSYTLTNSLGVVVLNGSNFGLNPPPTPSALVPADNAPFSFFIEANGFFGDNSCTWEVRCNNVVMASGCIRGTVSTSSCATVGTSTTNNISGCGSNLGAQTICSGSAITPINLSGPVAGTTFSWTRNNTATVTGIAANGTGTPISGTLTNTTNAPVVVTFTITPSANGCAGPNATVPITVNPIPNAVATPSTQTICSGPITTIALTSAVSGTTYAWTRNNTANVTGIAANGTGNISGSLTNTTLVQQTVTFTIIPTANGCTGTPITATVIVNAAPTITCPANMTLASVVGGCTAVATYAPASTGSPAPTFSYVLSGATTGSGSGTGSGLAFSVGVTTVTLTATNACGTATCSFTITVTDSQLPVISAQPVNRTVCAGASATFNVTAATSPSTGGPIAYQWQQWNGSAWVNVAGATTSSLTISNTTVSMNTNTYRVVLTGLCSIVNSSAASLYVNPIPTVIVSANPPASIMPNQTTTLTATANPSGGSYAWSFNGSAIPGATAQSYGPINIDGLGNYRVTYTSPAGCTATSADFQVTGAISDILWVYPNPNQGVFQVRFYNQSNEPATIMVFNAKGQKMHEEKVTTGGQAYSQILVDLSIVANGVYIVQLVNGAGKVLGAKQIIVEIF